MNDNVSLGDAIQQNVVCVSNLCTKRFQIGAIGAAHSFDVSAYDRIILLTAGAVKGCDLTENVYTEFAAPHMIIMEKNKEYVIESIDDFVEMYEISALRHNTGDIVNPDNLIRENYPFDTSRPFEDQINVD